MESPTAARPVVYVARVLIGLAVLALSGAWITQLTGGPLLGMGQQHLFNDAIALSLLGIAIFVDAFWHARRL
jgi:hypothetical protein